MRIGPYEVTGTLGRGGAGQVFRARAPSRGEVAIKVLRALDGDRLARFEREERLLAEFTILHGFVPLLASGRTPEGPYLVMPIIEGGTLRDRLEEGPLGVEETLRLGRRLASALAHAHARGIVHRDLKPENVLFQEGRPLVADLGLGKHFDKESPGASMSISLSADGEMRGTFGYMPREQMTDARAVGPEADVFALGAILYECLAGKPAFEGASVVQLLAAVSAGTTESLAKLCPAAPAWLVAAIERSLEPAPGDRFPDARALRAALEAPSRVPAVAGLVVALAGLALLVTLRVARPPAAIETPRAPREPAAPVTSVVPGKADFERAVQFDMGDGVAKDDVEARRLYARAADAGYTLAMVRFGDMLMRGRGGARDPREAVRLYRVAAEKGDTWGMFSLAQALSSGNGIDKDEPLACLWYQKASDGGNYAATGGLGAMLKDGRGVEKNEAEAARLLKIALEHENNWAKPLLADLYRTGSGVEKNLGEAVRLYKEAALEGSAHGMVILAGMYRDGEGVGKDEKAAAEWYQKAAEAGYVAAYAYEADVMRQGEHPPADMAAVVSLYRQGAERGDQWGMYRLGEMLETGSGVAKDVDQAKNWYRKAVGIPQAHAALRRLGEE